MMGHFMNNLYALELKSSESDHNIRITKNPREDTSLHIKFLEQANAGIHMNLLVFRKPDYITIGDVCEQGLGAFHVQSGVV